MYPSYDPPNVYDEDDLKWYGKKIAEEVRTGNEKEIKPDFDTLRKLDLRKKLNLPLRGLGVSIRILNALEQNGVMTIGQLVQNSHDMFDDIPNCGPKAVLECLIMLEELNLDGLWDIYPDQRARLARSVE